MKKILSLAIPLAVLCTSLGAPQNAMAATSADGAEMQKLQYLVGTWQCSWKAGSDSGTLSATFANVLNATWLEETERRDMGKGKLEVSSVHYTGYDQRGKKWLHFGPNADGTYEVAQSDDGNVWREVLPAAGTEVIFKRLSGTAFTLSEKYEANGVPTEYVQSCKKAQ